MHISWDGLQTVEALVRLGSVVSAAKALGLRHSSVSRRVDGLERTLGAPLFVRGARLRPTPLALKIAGHASLMAEQAGSISELLARDGRDRDQLLAVTTNDVLAPLLCGALARCGLTQAIRLSVSDEEVELTPGEVDLALRPGAHPGAALRGWRLGRLRLGLYASRRGRDGWIHPSEGLRARASMRWWKAVPGLAPGGVECDSLLAMREACAAGLGRAVLPAVLALDDARLHRVQWMEPGPPLWLLASATRNRDGALHAVAVQLASALRGHPGLC